jgi:hypothetical protein
MRQGFGPGAVFVWSTPSDPPEPLEQARTANHAMDATCQDVVEGDAQARLYDPTTPEIHPMTGRVPAATTAATYSRSPRRSATVGACRRRHEKEP